MGGLLSYPFEAEREAKHIQAHLKRRAQATGSCRSDGEIVAIALAVQQRIRPRATMVGGKS